MLICVVLAGGRGTRLIPLTDTCPKPLLRAGDKSLLEWNMSGTAPFVDKFVIVISYLGQLIIDQIGDSYLGKPVEYVWQQNPKGGTLDAFRAAIFENLKDQSNFLESKNSYLVIHADDIHGELTWQNMRAKIQNNPENCYLSGKVLTDLSIASSFGMFEVNQKISENEVDKLQKSLENQGKEIIVDCLLQNENGQILVQKRSANRRLFPNCWDLIGGHVDSGDTILETISKEIFEETSLLEIEIVSLIDQNEWIVPLESQKAGDNPNKVILQFLVKVQNLENLRLEEEKAVEFRWVSVDNDLEFLKENKAGDFYIHDTVQKTLSKIAKNSQKMQISKKENLENSNSSDLQNKNFNIQEFVKIIEKPDYFVSDLANIAISYFPSKVLQFIPKILPNTGKEAYITDLFNNYSQKFPIEVVPTMGSWLPITNIKDLENAREILK